MSLLANFLLAAAWVASRFDSFRWMEQNYLRDDRRLEAAMAVAVLAAALHRLGGPVAAMSRLLRPAAAETVPVMLIVLSVTADMLAARRFDLSMVHATLTLVGSYGVLGLYVGPTAWRASLPWAALLVLSLPFGAFSEVYLGFPARLLTAEAVAAWLEVAGVHSLTRETILTLDGAAGPAAMHVDVPCAGVRSLWSAAVFLLGAAAVHGRRLDRWFFAGGLLTTALVVTGNAVRVLVLVLLAAHLGRPDLAASVHVPLGLFGFAVALGAGWMVLRRGGVAPEPDDPPTAPNRAVAPALVLLLATSPAPPPPAPARLPFVVALPARLHAEPLAAADAERRFFAEAGVPTPGKWYFIDDAGLTGSVLLSPTRAWRVHHLPQTCLLGAGLAAADPTTIWVDADFAVRRSDVGSGRQTAFWWFQAPNQITDDLGVRTWAAIIGTEDRWVLASVLVDGSVSTQDPALVQLLRTLRSTIRSGLAAGEP